MFLFNFCHVFLCICNNNKLWYCLYKKHLTQYNQRDLSLHLKRKKSIQFPTFKKSDRFVNIAQFLCLFRRQTIIYLCKNNVRKLNFFKILAILFILQFPSLTKSLFFISFLYKKKLQETDIMQTHKKVVCFLQANVQTCTHTQKKTITKNKLQSKYIIQRILELINVHEIEYVYRQNACSQLWIFRYQTVTFTSYNEPDIRKICWVHIIQ